ncbi:glycosylphosphatidylinositol anchor attachment 1 protein-like [Liolophura sinensis]|uniref:glycosylphosphatidylinositol anchor attachment 1 protein-like n=1 Tax=Liolophura sinensis TaxID=3198878 RepID=UPI003158CDB0
MMGLLTDTKQREKLCNIIVKFNSKLCLVGYVVGFCWFLALGYQPFNAGTYFSENALLPGIVDADYYHQADFHSNFKELEKELESDKRKVPKEWLYRKFQSLGLDVYIQNFSIRYPLSLLPEGQVLPGENVYAILRAPRASSTEAVVLSSLFRPLASPYSKTTAGIALMLALANNFRKHTYWAKDIIFVVTEQEQVGMQAWLDGYHGFRHSEYIMADDLKGRGGAIQAAINLEIANDKNTHLNIKIEGLNGQLPNLDLVNLVVKLCRREGIRPTLHKRDDHRRPESQAGFTHTLKTMFAMMWSQATGMASGNHGLFHRYNIEALTLEGFRKKNHEARDLSTLAQVVEGTFRSLNNLLERFHQSFFFYILPSTNRYVSIGLYMPPLALMVLPCLIKAVALWILVGQRERKKLEEKAEEESKKSTDEGDKVSGDAMGDTAANGDDDSDFEEEEESDLQQSTWVQIVPIILVSMVIGMLAYTGPNIFAASAQSFRLLTDDALTFGILALFLAGLFFPNIVAKKSEGLQFNWEVLKCVTLIYQSLWIFSAALMNISLAYFLAVVMVPVTVMAHPIKNRLCHMLQMLLMLAVSPPALLYIAALVESYGGKHFSYSLWPGKAWDVLKQSLFLSILDNYLIGNWIFSFFSFAVMPSWLMSWAVTRIGR